MRHSRMVPYIFGCVGLFTVGAALAKDPVQAAGGSSSASAQPACIDSPKGRTRVLRTCGDQHRWIKIQSREQFSHSSLSTGFPEGLPGDTSGRYSTAAASFQHQR